MTRSIDDVLEYDKRCSRMNLLLKLIQNISDSEYQKKAWIECSIPNVVDSWEETICMFFDDTDIDEFLKILMPELNPEFGVSTHQIEQLWKLRNIVDSYNSKVPKYRYVDPKKVLADPEWHKVVECAKETLKAFDGYKVPTDDMLKF